MIFSTFKRAIQAPFMAASHPRVSPDSLSVLGSFVALLVFFAGLYLTAIAATAASESLHGILALCLFPVTIVAVWLVTAIDYNLRVSYHRWRDPR